MSTRPFPELGFYAVPGHVTDATALSEEVLIGERHGLGSVWLSAALSTSIGIASGLMSNMPLRNPLVTAAYASTMSKVTGDRFALGVGRGVDQLADATGTPRLDFALMADYLEVLRRLWRGEKVTHDGPAGSFRDLTLGADLEAPPPIIMAAMGDRTARWAGRHADAVVLNPLWSPRAVAHSTEQVRLGAEVAGRDPASVTVWAFRSTPARCRRRAT